MAGYSHEFLERATIDSGLHITRRAANVDDGGNDGSQDLVLNQHFIEDTCVVDPALITDKQW